MCSHPQGKQELQGGVCRLPDQLLIQSKLIEAQRVKNTIINYYTRWTSLYLLSVYQKKMPKVRINLVSLQQSFHLNGEI